MIRMPKVSCLMATYGRRRWVEEALACFLAQDYPNRELIILNNHPVPLMFEHPLVRIFHEPGFPTLGHCRNRLLDLAAGDFIRTWDDDDLYLPWTIGQGVYSIGEAPAFKPARSWWSKGPDQWELFDNVFEAAMLIRTEVARRYRYKESGGDEHHPMLAGIAAEGGDAKFEMGCIASYVYRFGWGRWHISGSLGAKPIEERTATWMEKNNEPGDGTTPMTPADVWPYWQKLADCAEKKYGIEAAAPLRLLLIQALNRLRGRIAREAAARDAAQPPAPSTHDSTAIPAPQETKEVPK